MTTSHNPLPLLAKSAALGLLVALLVALTNGCPGPEGDPDAGSCAATVTVGTYDGTTFTPLPDNAATELRLGFQGFRMLQLALRFELERGDASEAEVSAFVNVLDTDVELGQRTREGVDVGDGAFLVREWFVFFNDVPPSRVVGRDAELEVIVRAAGCVGGTTQTLAIRDDEDCVDTDIVIDDAGTIDGGTADAAVCSAP